MLYHSNKSKINLDLLFAFLLTFIFAFKFINCLPFSGYTRLWNYEGIASLLSYFVYSSESWSFPLGLVKNLAFPYQIVNIGNTGQIPFFALFFKSLGTIFHYFRTFDYFILLEIISFFVSILFIQKTLNILRVKYFSLKILCSIFIVLAIHL